MSTPTDGYTEPAPRVRGALAPHVDEFEAVAEETDDLEEEDVMRALAALGRGEPVPGGARQRILDRAKGGE